MQNGVATRHVRESDERAMVLDDRAERAILGEVRAGNLLRFDLFVDRYKGRLIRYLHQRGGNLSTAEDLTQEVFLCVFRAGAEETHGASVATWVFTIARRCLVDHVRAAEREKARLASMMPRESTLDPATAATLNDEHDRVARLLLLLPEEQREVLRLRIPGDLTIPEIAE